MKDKVKVTDRKHVKKIRQFILIVIGISIYLLGGVQFMSYIAIGIIFFTFGSVYRRLKVEYEDYKMLKLVQKSMIKLDDYKLLQEENTVLKDRINDLMKSLSGYSGMAGGLQCPPVHTGVQQQPSNSLTNFDRLKEVLRND